MWLALFFRLIYLLNDLIVVLFCKCICLIINLIFTLFLFFFIRDHTLFQSLLHLLILSKLIRFVRWHKAFRVYVKVRILLHAIWLTHKCTLGKIDIFTSGSSRILLSKRSTIVWYISTLTELSTNPLCFVCIILTLKLFMPFWQKDIKNFLIVADNSYLVHAISCIFLSTVVLQFLDQYLSTNFNWETQDTCRDWRYWNWD